MKSTFYANVLKCFCKKSYNELKNSLKYALSYGFIFDDSILNPSIIPDLIDDNDIKLIQNFNNIINNGTNMMTYYTIYEKDFTITILSKWKDFNALTVMMTLCACCIIKTQSIFREENGKDFDLEWKIFEKDTQGLVNECSHILNTLKTSHTQSARKKMLITFKEIEQIRDKIKNSEVRLNALLQKIKNQKK
jgi:hypothetical protein